MDRVLMLLICMLVGAAGGAAGHSAWEHRPSIGFRIPWPVSYLTKIKRIGIPDGPYTLLERERAASLGAKTNLAICRGNESTLRMSLAAQSTAVTALAKDSDRRARQLADGLQRAAGTIASAQRRASAMDFTPAGATLCEQFLDVDRHVVESRR